MIPIQCRSTFIERAACEEFVLYDKFLLRAAVILNGVNLYFGVTKIYTVFKPMNVTKIDICVLVLSASCTTVFSRTAACRRFG